MVNYFAFADADDTESLQPVAYLIQQTGAI